MSYKSYHIKYILIYNTILKAKMECPRKRRTPDLGFRTFWRGHNTQWKAGS